MQQILDLHIHSKYSRACSPQLTLSNIEKACRIKGVDIIATGDFTYPAWFKNIKQELEEINTGLYKLKTAKDDKIKFILSTELSLIYKSGDKARRIHIMLHAPNIKAVEKLNNFLDTKFNIRSDGRPILGISAPELVKLCLSIDPKFLIYPAHIWTPWFSVFGSKSGFDSMQECFQEQTKHIYAIETGLSSDPAMNWRLSSLDKLTILSNSDAHSLLNIGREANVMDLEKITYDEIYNIIKNKSDKLKYTIEFYPEEGMYHFDGHRNCNFSCDPKTSVKNNNICPKCKKPLIIGVMNRVEQLADRPEGYRLKKAANFKKLVGLDKIIAESMGIKSRQSKKVIEQYNNLIKEFKNELNILLNADIDEIKKANWPEIALGIKKVRQGDLIILPGFDGQYGSINIFHDHEKIFNKQNSMF
ncbi:MAG: endonuclease Q family protein [bacterium]